ncbi:hypothetical protein HMPREF9976_05786 [Staphylococcus epidermidis NIHLM003]|nr:hypothetical protein HMPREF9995_04955 [Staphylococcus epidermidis NIHLM095]EJD81813.1 hypothetical protein HMPREF9994_02164 [Staphylococcus epidermidis NIHLM088]EJD88564.1 hypothetical protein HMPREF9992_02357 [Staphylococcus epidermidis NIHLM070]EJE23125.1 hypothetical protein HMPREF9976_05786 [Staphylococcus epidermidis NIHLM003]DAT89574.1 MAG TPA: hypothetical protein [Caudoviricetes sp.]
MKRQKKLKSLTFSIKINLAVIVIEIAFELN